MNDVLQSAEPSFTGERNLLDELLAEQQRPAVLQFSKWHDAAHATITSHALADHYRNLIPAGPPGADEQYAFEVDLSICSGCKACVSACHSLNGLDDEETWRDVGVLYGDLDGFPIQQVVTTACHHCADPACLNGCPVLAYEKDEITGIVRHLDDQCIGCQYCILKCPYDVPKYSAKRGIVRKCDMCHSRLAAGEAPACVQACPNEAIQIATVLRDDIAALPPKPIVPGAFRSDYTKPSTRYLNAPKVSAPVEAGGSYALRPECPHWPLVIMLVLTQMSVGLFAARAITGTDAALSAAALSVAALLVGVVGLGASILHLGQPLKAWRAFLNLRRSWLSREVIGFGGFAAAAAVAAALDLAPHLPLPVWVPRDWIALGVLPIICMALCSGAACVFCSVMVYVDTRRAFWRMSRTAVQFIGTALALGGFGGAAVIALAGGEPPALLGWIGAMALLVKLGAASNFQRADVWEKIWEGVWTDDARSAATLLGPLQVAHRLRFAAGIMALFFVAMAPVAAALLCLVSEVTDRYLFFRGVVAYRMPGVQ